MGCCSDQGCDQFFTERSASRDARRYRKKGLDAVSARVVELAGARGVQGSTVLEVGGGVGAVQLELLKAGASEAVGVELSPAYETYASELIHEAGLEGRVERRILDFAQRAEEVAPADVVVLNRVVCCYPDFETLLGAAAERARRLLVFTYPRDRWWLRLGLTTVNFIQWLRRSAFRAYLHPPAALRAVAAGGGLRPIHEHEGVIWALAAFERV